MKKAWWGIGVLVIALVALAYVNKGFSFDLSSPKIPKVESATDAQNAAMSVQRDACHAVASEYRNNSSYNRKNIDSTLKGRGCNLAKVIQGNNPKDSYWSAEYDCPKNFPSFTLSVQCDDTNCSSCRCTAK